jgi:predicted enzyme related to lactoylglutathione lyase
MQAPRFEAQGSAGRRGRIVAWGVLGLAPLLACASSAPMRLPPVTGTPTQLVVPGKFVWQDLVTQDVAEARSFYGALFGWTFEEQGRYTQVLHDGEPIAGMLPAADPERTSEWVGNLSVADVDRAAALIAERGGVVERGPIDAPARGRLALVSDPDGALLLLVRASTGDPPDADPRPGRWLWRELWARDVDAAAALYAELAGYEVAIVELEGAPYHVLKDGSLPRAGMLEAPPEVNPAWLPYVRVEDAQATAARAAALGARIVLQDEGSAILVDPTGAPIGIQVWDGGAGADAGAGR